MTMRDEMNRAGPMMDRLNAAIRDNPLAAGLIGAGVAWMLLGGSKGLGAVAGVATSAANNVGSAASTAMGAVTTGLTNAGSKFAGVAKDLGSEVTGSVASIVPDLSGPGTEEVSKATSDARSAAGDGLNLTADKSRQFASAMQSRLSESLDRQPLLLGAIGLAIGAGIASTFATTSVESEWMGEQGTAAREKLQDLADDVKDRAGEAMSRVKEEADRQGLTAAGAKNAASGIGEKVKTVAGAARESVTQRFSS